MRMSVGVGPFRIYSGRGRPVRKIDGTEPIAALVAVSLVLLALSLGGLVATGSLGWLLFAIPLLAMWARWTLARWYPELLAELTTTYGERAKRRAR